MDTVSSPGVSRRRLLGGTSLLVMSLLLAGCGGHGAAPSEPVVVGLTATATEPRPSLPPADRIGGVRGAGYDEPLAVDRDPAGHLLVGPATRNRAVVATIRPGAA